MFKFFARLAFREPVLPTPDELIAAAVIQKIAEDFEAFTPFTVLNFGIKAEKLKLQISWRKDSVRYGLGGKTSDFNNQHCQRGDSGSGLYKNTEIRNYYIGGAVNGVPISDSAVQKIGDAYLTLSEEVRKAKEVAEKALLEMEENEKKWNLVESLNGMKRTPEGALVCKKNRGE